MNIPAGFLFGAASAGFRSWSRHDLAAVLSTAPAVAAGMFTTNRFQAAPVVVARERLESGRPMRGIVVNAGQANACTGEEGLARCRQSLELSAAALGVNPEELLPASTGVIGDHLRMEKWRTSVDELGQSMGRTTPEEFAKAIMTTDTFPKTAFAEVALQDGSKRSILGFAKGAGMICPNMATMLVFCVTDACVTREWLEAAVRRTGDRTFNRITVDGDTSTNDCVLVLANGSGELLTGEEPERFEAALLEVFEKLAWSIVADAEGGTKVIRISVVNAVSDADAECAARAVGHSPLVKTALFGKDPNWGRIVAALGRSGASFIPENICVRLAGITIFRKGQPVEMDVDTVFAPHLAAQEVPIEVDLAAGTGRYCLLTSDLTYDYVKINAGYRT